MAFRSTWLAVRRASAWGTGEVSLLTCGAEDLVVYKVFAGRDRDWADVAGVVVRQRESLDRALILSELPRDLSRFQELLDTEG